MSGINSVGSGSFSFQRPEINIPQGPPESGSNLSFKDVLTDYIDTTNQKLNGADNAIKDFVSGKSDNPDEIMIRLEEAHLALQLTIQMRNKVVEAYQEMMRMQL